MSKQKNLLLRGTLILMVTGFITRLLGFFYRIFLAGKIGAEGMGIYHLIFPVFSICFSICGAPVQTSISRFVAAAPENRNRSARAVFFAGLSLSLVLSLLCTFVLYRYAPWIAARFLLEPRTAEPVRLLALSIPFNALHSCINGYYYGKQQTEVPAVSQLIEQITRVLFVWILSDLCLRSGKPVSVSVAVAGLVIGELAAVLFSMLFLNLHFFQLEKTSPKETHHIFYHMKQILKMSVPLTANRLVLSILQSIEAVLIPASLKTFGLSTSEAFSVYGIFTGMAMPFILFPSTITNSVAVMLLPDIARFQTQKNDKKISERSSLTITYSFLIGILFTILFLLFGNFLGNYFFHNPLAGTYITILAWLCPFMYLNTTVSSILNGLGKTNTVFCHQVAGITVLLLVLIFLVPRFGMYAYLVGTLGCDLLISALHIRVLKKETDIRFLLQ